MLPLLIAVSGKLGSGKDYIAENFLLPLIHGVVSKMAFADQIKINVASQNANVDLINCLQGNKSMELRRLLQIAGTEQGRDRYHPDIWIDTLENWIKLRVLRDGTPDVVLVTDCRFPNEADWIERNSGLLIRVNANSRNEIALRRESNGNEESYNAIKNHPSETSLDDYQFTYNINNDPEMADTVKDQICEIITQYLGQHLNQSKYFKLPFDSKLSKHSADH